MNWLALFAMDGFVALPLVLLFLGAVFAVRAIARGAAKGPAAGSALQPQLPGSPIAAPSPVSPVATAPQRSPLDDFRRRYADWDRTAFSYFDNSFIAISFAQQNLALGRIPEVKSYDFAAVVSVEVVKDGATVALRTDQPHSPFFFQDTYFEERALLKAIESPTLQISTLTDLTLKIAVSDPVTPVYAINFFRAATAVGEALQSPHVTQAVNDADAFHAYLTDILAKRQAVGGGDAGRADALGKLWALRQAGALSEEEFTAQKAKLLSNG
jgi:hypothetical protein